MKYLKILLLVFSSLVISACSATYNLDIDKKLNLSENLNLSLSYNSDYDKLNEFDYYLPVNIKSDDYSIFTTKHDDVEYFDIKKSSNAVDFSYKYSNYVDIDSDRIINTCYDYFNVINKKDKDDNNRLILSTSKKFKCFDEYDNLDDVTVNITTKKKVYDNNADSVDGNTYTWHISEENKDNASINIIIDGSTDSSLSFVEKNMFLIILIGIFVLGLITYFIVKKHSEAVNS